MKAQEIESILNELTVAKDSSIRGKSKAIDKIMALHLKKKSTHQSLGSGPYSGRGQR